MTVASGEPKNGTSSGLPSLDAALQGVLPGDNIVWQVESIHEYLPFIRPYSRYALSRKTPLVYFRFGQHARLLPAGSKAREYRLHPEGGFEAFISEIFDVIEKTGEGAYYLFDCLSELAVDWYSDRMLGNFFSLACPYLYQYRTVAYFALLKNHHTADAIVAIHNTAQVVLDVYRNREHIYIQPVKVDGRYSPTLHTLHVWEGEEFRPVTRSATITEILSGVPQPWLDFAAQRVGVWQRIFQGAQTALELVNSGKLPGYEAEAHFDRILRMAITRDDRVLHLAETYFNLADLLAIRKRMVGTGLIGGKSVGMLLARAILKGSDRKWRQLLEEHDSFYIGSDVFYTYLVHNDCWWPIRRLKKSGQLTENAQEVRERILGGHFPQEILEQYKEMLDYFGQSPVIVRSSSLLEDAYGNAFSGKYESVFCANRGTRDERLAEFTRAIQTVYASTLSREALLYREQRGLLENDEQMALLIQRVSGDAYGDYFFPQAAGVGFSFNPYVWNTAIDPKAGMLRLVFGLGTRAVDRTDDDYTRIVALNAPDLRPEGSRDQMRRYTQRKVDVLDLAQNRHASYDFESIASATKMPQLDVFASQDSEGPAAVMGSEPKWRLTFEKLLASDFVANMGEMLSALERAYDYPVDVEFTVNFLENGSYRINVVQCRPFQVKRTGRAAPAQSRPNEGRLVLRTDGPVIGNAKDLTLDRIVVVRPATYGKLGESDRYSVARLIGRILKSEPQAATTMLLGPGRFCTSVPSLGIPTAFAEINNVSVLCEIAAMHEGLVPDVSLGTHFFNDLVELDMLYLAVHPRKNSDLFQEDVLLRRPNSLSAILPQEREWEHVIHVIESRPGFVPRLHADPLLQKAVLYLSDSDQP